MKKAFAYVTVVPGYPMHIPGWGDPIFAQLCNFRQELFTTHRLANREKLQNSSENCPPPLKGSIAGYSRL
eukprot:3547245-Rhodomonas_salina.1